MGNARTLRRTVLAVGFATLAVPALAHAEPRMHDGFYLQVTGALGYYSSSGDAAGAEQSFSGMTLGSSLMMGGSVIPGLIVGGGFFFDRSGSPTYELNGMEVDSAISSQLVLGIGAFGDYYLDPAKGGLHFTGFLGWGGLETSFEGGGAGGSDPTGLVLAAGGGYDVWISDEWSAGGMVRVAYGKFSLNDTAYGTFAPALLGTLTWH